MLDVFKDKQSLDARCVSLYDLSEEILMENAARSLCDLIKTLTHKNSMIIIVCGGGNNGADGYALARLLAGDHLVKIYAPKAPKSPLCELQSQRAQNLGIEMVKRILPCDVLVDCLIGSGCRGSLDEESKKIIKEMQKFGRVKIACDVPSGLDAKGVVQNIAFRADYTLAMGALSLGLFSDSAKDYVGEIHIGNLGLALNKYTTSSQIKYLEKSDFRPPIRRVQNAHKGDFGHLCILAGRLAGASSLAGLAALRSGCGSVSILGDEIFSPELMKTSKIPENITALAVGMGLEKEERERIFALLETLPCDLKILFDATLLRLNGIEAFLQKFENLTITPHIGEFLDLWNLTSSKALSKADLLESKADYLLEFSQKFKHVTIVLKSANTFIAKNGEIFIHTLGHVGLAKAGSGDVLAGLIASFLAQGSSGLHSAIQGSLMQALSAQSTQKNNYSTHPLGLISEIHALKFQYD